MVIECENCNTRFHLAEGRISAKGARVRCSNCHHRFHVQPPPQSQKNAGDSSTDLSASQTGGSSQPSHGGVARARDAGPSSLDAAAASFSAPNAGRGLLDEDEEADLDNPEFLFDAPAGTPEPRKAAKPRPTEVPPMVPPTPERRAAPSSGPGPHETGQRQAIHSDELLGGRRASDASGEPPLLGFEPTIPDEKPDFGEAEDDDDMPMLEVERGQAGVSARAAAKQGAVDASASFDDVLAKDLDEDDDDTIAGWNSLGIAAPVATTKAAAAPARGARSDNILDAVHKSRERAPQRAEPVPEPEYELPHRRRSGAIVQAAALAIGLVALGGAVRLVALHGVGTPPGPSEVLGAGWKASDIQAFHAQDLSRRRVLVLRGSLSAGSPTPPPTIEATLLDSSGRIIGEPVPAQLVRLPDEALQPEDVSEQLAKRAATPEREHVQGFTVLVLDPPAQARRFYLDLH